MLKIGQRVSRQIEIGKPERRYGEIVNRYKSKQGVGFIPITLYDVKFDNSGIVEKGFMEEYLQVEK